MIAPRRRRDAAALLALLALLPAGCVALRIPEDAGAPPGAIRGRAVRASDGAPEGEARIEVALSGDEARAVPADAAPDGSFALEGLPQGTHDVRIEAADERRALLSVDLWGGAEVDLGEVALRLPVLVEGTVREARGPLAGARVACLTDAADRIFLWGQLFEEPWTDARGRFGFGERLGGRAALLVTRPAHEGGARETRLFRTDLPDGGVLRLDLVWEAGLPWRGGESSAGGDDAARLATLFPPR
jgi:hypothetical protein